MNAVSSSQTGITPLIHAVRLFSADYQYSNESRSKRILDQRTLRKIVVLLLRYGANSAHKDVYGRSACDYAVESGDEILERLISDKTKIGFEASNRLTDAVCEGSIGAINYILYDDPSSSVNGVDKYGNTPLECAICTGHLSILEALLRNATDLGQPFSDGSLPLVAAVRTGNPELVKVLLTHGANPNLTIQSENISALKAALDIRDWGIILLLVDHGAEADVEDDDGYSLLLLAVREQKIEIVKAILKGSPETRHTISRYDSPLTVAVQVNRIDILRLLLESGRFSELLKQRQTSPLVAAIDRASPELVDLLLHHEAELDAGSNASVSSLIKAIQRGDSRMIDVLLSQGVDANAALPYPPLLQAVQHGNAAVIQSLLSGGADPNACARDGIQPLVVAVNKGKHAIVEALLQAKADPNSCCSGIPVLSRALENCDERCFEMLIVNGADVGVLDAELASCQAAKALRLAVACRMEDITNKLLQQGVDPNAVGDLGGTLPLIRAVKELDFGIIDLLLRSKADHDQIDPLLHSTATVEFVRRQSQSGQSLTRYLNLLTRHCGPLALKSARNTLLSAINQPNPEVTRFMKQQNVDLEFDILPLAIETLQRADNYDPQSKYSDNHALNPSPQQVLLAALKCALSGGCRFCSKKRTSMTPRSYAKVLANHADSKTRKLRWAVVRELGSTESWKDFFFNR